MSSKNWFSRTIAVLSIVGLLNVAACGTSTFPAVQTSPVQAATSVSRNLKATATPAPPPKPTAHSHAAPAPPTGGGTGGVITSMSQEWKLLKTLKAKRIGATRSVPTVIEVAEDPTDWFDVDDNVSLKPGTTIVKEDEGQLVRATARDLVRGKQVKWWGTLAASFPELGEADYILIEEGDPLRLGPSSRPDAIHSLEPNEHGETCRAAQLYVTFNLNDSMRKDGLADLSKVALWVDGKDVTRLAEARGTISLPQSLLSLLYRGEMKVGVHTATVWYRDDQGKPRSYTWSFTVKRNEMKSNRNTWPCPQ